MIPLNNVNETYAKLALPSIDAIIGMDILVKGDAKIHIDTGILELKNVASTPPKLLHRTNKSLENSFSSPSLNGRELDY